MGTTTTLERRSVGAGAARRATRHRQRVLRRWKRIGVVAAAALAVAGTTAGVWVLAGGDDERVASGTTIDLALGDYFISGDLTVPAGELTLHATNVGIEPHDVGIRGKGITTTLFTGDSADLDVILEPGTYELFCDVSDHVQRGMVATLTVTEPVAAEPASG